MRPYKIEYNDKSGTIEKKKNQIKLYGYADKIIRAAAITMGRILAENLAAEGDITEFFLYRSLFLY